VDDQGSGLTIQVDTFERNLSMRFKPDRVATFIQTIQGRRREETDYS
jgi:hypothetical protein